MLHKVFGTAIMLLYVSILTAQVITPVTGRTNERLLPTKYATILYASQVSDTSGNNKLIAAHFTNRGGGTFTWEKTLADAGAYEIAICYATRFAGSEATISTANNDSCSATLDPTTGYYPQSENWYQFNCERRRIPGQIHLLKGSNTISLHVSTIADSAETSLYSIELIPVSQRSAIEKDWKLAKKMSPSGKWFADAGYGVMFHWTSQSTPERGSAKPYAKAVHDFDVHAFAAMVEKMGAAYVILTTNHAEPYFPAPLHAWEKAYPGHTTERDLIEEIADSLRLRHVRLFLYMATHVYAKYDSVDDDRFSELNYSLVKEIGERYKEKVAGYWFDGWYQSYEKHPHFDFEKFYEICKAGNAQRLIGLNTWLYPANTLWQDYWAGEVYTMGTAPAQRVLQNGPGNGLPSHNLIVMEKENWYHDKPNTKIPPPDLQASELIRFIRLSKGKGPVTINMQIYQDGRVGEEALSVMQEVKKEIRN